MDFLGITNVADILEVGEKCFEEMSCNKLLGYFSAASLTGHLILQPQFVGCTCQYRTYVHHMHTVYSPKSKVVLHSTHTCHMHVNIRTGFLLFI